MKSSPHELDSKLAADLAARERAQLLRRRIQLDGPQAVEVVVDGARLLSFCSNDYLGLANHPAVVAAFKSAADTYGVGAGASHLVSGHSRAHHALEEELADFVGAPRALLFSTGYMANLGVVAALAPRGSVIFEDKLNHASLLDAARGATRAVKRYAHCDSARLAQLLAHNSGAKIIASDGVFSMDGDLAPLPALAALARAHAAWLLLDDAHGVGVLGANGSGSFAHWGEPVATPAILMGTLGKALGTFGAFVAGSHELIETLIQHARTYIYTTALPPAVAQATRASLALVRTESWRREQLHAHIAQFRNGVAALGLRLMDSATPIQPILFGSTERAVAASAFLRSAGILVPAIRPPTVPQGGARLRVTLCASHTSAHIERLLATLAQLPISP